MSGISCIVYPPTLEYNYLIQRPQQLMRGFSEYGISSFFMNASNTYSGDKRGIQKLNPYLYLVNEIDPRPYFKGQRPVLYYTAAAQVEMVNYFNPCLVIFDSVDEPSEEFETWKPYYYHAVSTADVVLAASDKLYETAAGINHNTHLIPNACDYEYFSGASPLSGRPAEIADISGPIIGYIGVMATWCDMELIARVADSFPHCNLVMVGPLYNLSSVPQRPNIHWLGFKPYGQLAAYVASFDVGIIPFKNTSMTQSVNPIKMWEYMAAGIPVVTTALPEALKYSDLVYYSNNGNEFILNIKQSLTQDSEEKRQQRKEVARQNSWRERAGKILEIIEYELLKRGINESGIDIGDETLATSIWDKAGAFKIRFGNGQGGRPINVVNTVKIGKSGVAATGRTVYPGVPVSRSGTRITTRKSQRINIRVR